MGMERLIRVMRTRLLRRLEEERKKRKEVFRLRMRTPYKGGRLKGSLERRPRLM